MTDSLLSKLEKVLEFEGTRLPYKEFPMFVLEYDEKNELTEKANVMNEHLRMGMKFSKLKPILEKLIECVRALEKIEGYVGDHALVLAENVLAALEKELEKI